MIIETNDAITDFIPMGKIAADNSIPDHCKEACYAVHGRAALLTFDVTPADVALAKGGETVSDVNSDRW